MLIKTLFICIVKKIGVMTDSGHVLCPSSGSCHHIVASSLLSGQLAGLSNLFCNILRELQARWTRGAGQRICGHNFLVMTRLLIHRRHYKFQWCTVPKVIDFPTYNTKCSGENKILRGIFRIVSRFPIHFVSK